MTDDYRGLLQTPNREPVSPASARLMLLNLVLIASTYIFMLVIDYHHGRPNYDYEASLVKTIAHWSFDHYLISGTLLIAFFLGLFYFVFYRLQSNRLRFWILALLFLATTVFIIFLYSLFPWFEVLRAM